MPIGVAIVESQFEFVWQFGEGGRIETDTRTQRIQVFDGAVVAGIGSLRQNLGWLRNLCSWEPPTFNHVKFSELAGCQEFSTILLRPTVLYDDGRLDSGNHRWPSEHVPIQRTRQMGTSPLIEERPDPGGLRRLEEVIYEFNLQATGISDGKRRAHSAVRRTDRPRTAVVLASAC